MASKRSDPLENHSLERVAVKHDASKWMIAKPLVVDNSSLAFHPKSSIEEAAYRQWKGAALDCPLARNVASRNLAVAVPQLGARFVDRRVGEDMSP